MTNDFTLDDVLDSIMVAEEDPSYDAMNRWIERFPQYRKDLSRFFATWAIQAVHPDEAPPIDSGALASRGVSYALNLLHKENAGPGQTLLGRARSVNLSEDQLAARTQLDDHLLQKLNRRLLVGVHAECLRRLATALNESVDSIAALVTGEPQFGVSRHKADGKPVRAQEDFLTAIKNSSLPEDLKDEWIKIAAAEKASKK